MHLNESSSNSSIRFFDSTITICAFRWYKDRFLVKHRTESKWAKVIERPKSSAFASHDVTHVEISVDFDGWLKSVEEINKLV